MKTYYFPSCGFGFWYLLGIFDKFKTKNNINTIRLCGSSGGALICLCSLINTKKPLFNKLINLAEYSLYTANNKYNLYETTVIFIDKIIELISKTNNNINFNNIKIQVTRLEYFCLIKEQVTPKNIKHLRELCIASVYIPIISNLNNKLYYSICDVKYIDGGFAELLYPENNYVNVKYGGVFPPDKNECQR